MLERKPINFDQEWEILQKGITKMKNVLEGLLEFNSNDMMKLYDIVFTICTQEPPNNYCHQLYDKYWGSVKEYITSMVLPSLREKHGVIMLGELVKRWEIYKVMDRRLSFSFSYLSNYIDRNSLSPLNEIGLKCFRDLVYQVLNSKVRDAVQSLIDQEREGEHIDSALLKNVLDIFVEVGMGKMDYYEKDFEAAFLKDTGAYFSRKASNWFLEKTTVEYMLNADECLIQEMDRVSHYLHSSSKPKLLQILQHELFSVYANQLLEKVLPSCHTWLRDDKVEELSRIVCLFSKIPCSLTPISSIFNQHVTAEGISLIKQAEDAAISNKAEDVAISKKVFVRKVIELHDKYLALVNEYFQNHLLFRKALKEAFEVICNKGVAGNSSAELLAYFCDVILKGGGSGKLREEAIEEMLEKVVKLLAYVSDKDMFSEFYRVKLVRRLLFGKNANEYHEKSILTKLKLEYGYQFTFKLEGMVTDLTLARENQANFEDYLSNNTNVNLGIDLTVAVLTAGFWPSYKSCNINLPAEMVKCVQVYQQFYETQTKGRKLKWVHSLGTCNLSGKFDTQTIELIVTTFQASALLLFNTSDRLSYMEIKTELSLNDAELCLDDDDLMRILHSLSCAKYEILIKEPNTKTILRTDHFQFNSKFTEKMRRVKIPLPSVDIKKKAIKEVEKDRRFVIEASIVRIMKTRKVLGLQQLAMECAEQLTSMFKPDLKEIKKRIDDLITRDYLERDERDPRLMRYLV